MALVIKVNGVTLTHRVRLNDGTNNGIDGLTSAADGSGSMGGIIIDDPNHDLVLQGWQTVTVEESDCTTAPRLFTGFIGDRTTTHGNYPTDGGRQVNVTLYDQNVLLSWALITGTDGKRPEESRTARIDWLLGSAYLDTIVFDTGFVVPSGASDFQEADYRGQYPRDVLDDVLGAFQVAFAFWDEAADKVGLFYDAMTATTMDSTLTISNDPADWTFADGVISGTCWPPYVDAELAQDPSEVYSLERLTYTNGLLLREDASTKAQFFPSPYPDRGQATDRSRIGKAQTASDYINALLAQASAEKETVTCTLLLPSTHVGLVDAGQRISVKFVHLDGYEDFVYTRITSRTTRQALGRSDLYEVQLTLNQRGPFGGGGGGGGSNPPPTTFPPGPPVASTLVQNKLHNDGSSGLNPSVTLDNPPSPGDLLVWVQGWRSTATVPSVPLGFTEVDHVASFKGEVVVVAYRIAQAGDGTTFSCPTSNGKSSVMDLSEWSGSWPTNPVDVTANDTGGGILPDVTVTPTAGESAIVIAGAINSNSNTPQDYNYTSGQTLLGQSNVNGTGPTDGSPVTGAAVTIAPATSGSYSIGFAATSGFPGDGSQSYWAEQVVVFAQTAGSSEQPPAPGQENARPETVTMTGAAGTTRWPFADGTLHVFVDNVEQTAKLVSQDGVTGDFTLGFTPTPTEVVTVEYLGR